MSEDPKTPIDPLAAAEERDREWLAHVYRGDKERDLTPRAVVAGMIFGGLMALSNLYVGLKSGWGLGVDIAAVIVIFAVFKGLRGIGLVKREFGMLECTTTMTVAVAASWISSAGLVSAVPALTLLTGYEFVWWQLTLFIAVILFLGLFMAIPLKRQMIQVDSLRFPSNIPTGETLKAMYAKGGDGMKKAKAMGIAGVLGMLTAGLRDGLAWLPAQLSLPVQINRVSMEKLTLSAEPSMIFISIGALFGIKVGLSMLAGVILNYSILAPGLINDKVIQHAAPRVVADAPPAWPLTVSAGQSLTVLVEEADRAPELAAGAASRTVSYTWTQATTYQTMEGILRDLSAPTLGNGEANPFHKMITAGMVSNKATKEVRLSVEAPAATTWEARLSIPKDQSPDLVRSLGFKPGASTTQSVGGFRNISAWSLWPGATILVVGGLLALAFQWRTLGKTFAGIFTALGKKKDGPKGILDHIEIPMTWFVAGFCITCVLAVLLLVWLFSIHWWMGLIAVFMTFLLSAVAARAGAEIGMNPIGALGKVTQLTYGAMAPGNIPANLMTAGVTSGAACSCSDTVGNLKVGHMVGANPRRQFIAQLFGVFAGALLAVPAYFVLVPDATALGGEKFPAPSALVWMGVAKVLSQGLDTLPASAVQAVVVAFIAGCLIVIIDRFYPKARPYTPSPAALGIALTIPASTSLAMFLGALIAWMLERKAPKWNSTYTIPIASGCIAGESIMGVVLAVILAFGSL